MTYSLPSKTPAEVRDYPIEWNAPGWLPSGVQIASVAADRLSGDITISKVRKQGSQTSMRLSGGTIGGGRVQRLSVRIVTDEVEPQTIEAIFNITIAG